MNPILALFVANDDDPLLFYRKISAIKQTVFKGSVVRLYFEINEYLGVETGKNVKWKQGFKHVQLKKDMFGKDRMIKMLAI